MGQFLIRHLDDDLKRQIRIAAATHGRSMEEEVRAALEVVFAPKRRPQNLGQALRHRFAALGGVDFEIPERASGRPVPDFSGPEFGAYDDEDPHPQGKE